MNYIKKSFKKTILPIVISCAFITLAGWIMNWLTMQVYGHFTEGTTIVQGNFLSYLSMLKTEDNWYTTLMSILGTLIVSPLYIGMYKFCFARLQDENPKIVSMLDFYKSPKRVFGSFAAKNLLGAAAAVAMAVLNMTIGIFLSFAASDYGTASAVTLASTATMLIMTVVTLIVSMLFFFTEYCYALFPEDGVINAVRNSFARAKRCRLKILGIIVLTAAVNYAIEAFLLSFGFWLSPITAPAYRILSNTVIMWIGVTFAHAVLLSDKPKAENKQADEETDEDLVVKPYDFFIEADTRFTDSKTFEAEAIREVDILAVLDEMNLADEVKTNWGVKRKLKRLFDDLAFEVGEYVTYEGGREISGTEIEELDERELEISVEISRGSDSEPFTAVIAISEVEE